MALIAGLFTRFRRYAHLEKEIAKYKLDTLPVELLSEAKMHGFSDEQICRIMNDGNEDDVYEKRKAAWHYPGI